MMPTVIKKWMGNEVVRYAITGGLITLMNTAGYFAFLQFGMVYTYANAAILILSKTAGYILNKYFVYHSKCENISQAFSECVRFVLARGFTGIVDFSGMIFLIECIGMGERISKFAVMLLVIILNYILGKKAVFKVY